MRNNICKRIITVLLAVCLLLPYAVMPKANAAGAENDSTEEPYVEDQNMINETTANTDENCTCNAVDGVHQDGCPLFTMPDDSGDNIEFKVGMYMDANRQQHLVNLTPEGAHLDDWKYNAESFSAEDRYLGVVINGLSMSNDKQYQLVVEMAPILYINQNNDPTQTYTTLSYTKNAPIVVNTNGKYTPNKYSLSNLTYLIDKGTKA